VKTKCEHIPEQMVHKSLLKCGISKKMARTEDNALYEDFLGEGIAETGCGGDQWLC